MRLTADVRQKLLENNEGKEFTKSYSSKNSSFTNFYKIKDGKLIVRETGKTSWADSRYDDEHECDEETTHRFLRNNLCDLDTDGIE